MKLGGGDESPFGFFTGISGHLYHRFYVTPGIHFGQFADFPVGFGNGSTVPENFGELNPVKRWTARFGLAITFKAKDFSSLGSSGKPKVTGDEASPKPTPSPSPSPSPSTTETSSSVLNLSNAPLTVAANFLRLPSQRSLREVSTQLDQPGPETVSVPEPLVQPTNFTATAAPDSRHFLSSSTSLSATTHVNSITSSKMPAVGERVSLNAAAPIREYAFYFRNGRFFLSLPRARLDLFQEGLKGEVFSDAAFEQRGDELVISFALSPGTKARIQDQVNGLAVIFFSTGTN